MISGIRATGIGGGVTKGKGEGEEVIEVGSKVRGVFFLTLC